LKRKKVKITWIFANNSMMNLNLWILALTTSDAQKQWRECIGVNWSIKLKSKE
jgi:hypothetical protein